MVLFGGEGNILYTMVTFLAALFNIFFFLSIKKNGDELIKTICDGYRCGEE